ncbi:FHA domain-containing protein [Streptomyces sp. NPDC049954]|uniref:FHA domain-containing protein n=1 Tax=Streptomyces sp. NPDC049954 TaxID=3155779 RepID=UPI003445D2E1
MQIRLTLLGPRGGHPARTCDVLVTAPAGTTLSAVAAGLASAAQAGEGPAVLYAGGQRLDAQRAVLGEPPLVDGAVLSLGAPVPPGPTPDGSTPQLHILSGPDAGGVHLLHGGEISLGRSAGADITLDDPDVSRTHCAVTVDGAGRVRVADLGSTNGTTLDGRRVGPEPVPLSRGSLLRVGESVLRVVPGAAPPLAATTPDGEGHVRVRIADRPPAEPATPARGTDLPGLAETLETRSAPDASGGLPARPEVPDPAAADGPGPHVAPPAPAEETRGGRRRGLSKWTRRFGGRAGEEVPDTLPGLRGGAAESGTGRFPATFAGGQLRAGGADPWPDPAALLLTALGPGTRLWERGPGHPESLVVRVGTADRTGQDGVTLTVPVTVSLREAGALGLAGPRERLLGLARSVLAQLAALHSPDLLEIVLVSADQRWPVAGRTADWSWLGWLPQARPTRGQDCRVLVAYDREQARARIEELRRRPHDAARAPHTVVVLDGDPGTPALREAAAWCASEGPAAGVHLLCLAETPAATAVSPVADTFETACAGMPAFRDCGAVALLSGEVATGLHLLRTVGGTPAGSGTVGTADGVSAAWAERFARALAPLRTDAAPGDPQGALAAPLPQAARLLDELGLARATPASLLARWAAAADEAAARGGRALAVLGAGPHGPATVDLDGAHGPHLLVEGPPGSGRTELLRSVSASLAAGERPDRLGLVLIDGGGAPAHSGDGLGVCLDLPHVSTHLVAQDPVRMREFAQSLTAELKRRARLLDGTDFLGRHALSRPGSPAGGGLGDRLTGPRPARGSEAETHGRGIAGAASARRRESPAQGERRRETRADLPPEAALAEEIRTGAYGSAATRTQRRIGYGDYRDYGDREVPPQRDGTLRTDVRERGETRGPGEAYEVRAARQVRDAGDTGRAVRSPWDVPAARGARDISEARSERSARTREAARPETARPEAVRQEAARPEAVRQEAVRQEAARREAPAGHPADAPVARSAGHAAAERGAVPPLYGERTRPRAPHGESVPPQPGAPRAERSGDGDLDAPPSRTLRLRPNSRTQQSGSPTSAQAASRTAAQAVAEAAEDESLPRLVVVVDDLDALLDPPLGSTARPAAGSVVRALEAVAREGARLGVHLVAAATRTERVAVTELARGAGLRITLDAPSTAPEDPAPGRGRLHTPDGAALPFQGGRVTGRIPRTATLRPTVLPLEWERMGDPPARRPVRELGNGPTDLALLASALDRAARSTGAQGPPPLI